MAIPAHVEKDTLPMKRTTDVSAMKELIKASTKNPVLLAMGSENLWINSHVFAVKDFQLMRILLVANAPKKLIKALMELCVLIHAQMLELPIMEKPAYAKQTSI